MKRITPRSAPASTTHTRARAREAPAAATPPNGKVGGTQALSGQDSHFYGRQKRTTGKLVTVSLISHRRFKELSNDPTPKHKLAEPDPRAMGHDFVQPFRPLAPTASREERENG